MSETFEAIPIRLTIRSAGMCFTFTNTRRMRSQWLAARHYGTRRVTARQYRAWKRQVTRQRDAARELTRMRTEEGA